MTREEAINYFKRSFAIGEDDGEKYHNEVLEYTIKALEQEPMENFESTKDHILKLAGDYKCWDNRLTHDEALELFHMLEQEPVLDKIRAEIEKLQTYKMFIGEKTVYVERDDVLAIIDKYKEVRNEE